MTMSPGIAYGIEAAEREILLHIVGGEVIRVGMWGVRGGLTALRAMKTVWNLPPSARGFAIERMLGGNLPAGFKTIDKFIKGIATSIKSIDLTAKSYQKSGALFSRLKSYVNKVAGFNGASMGNRTIKASDITSRSLEVGVQKGAATAAEKAEIDAAIAYGRSKGVSVTVREIK